MRDRKNFLGFDLTDEFTILVYWLTAGFLKEGLFVLASQIPSTGSSVPTSAFSLQPKPLSLKKGFTLIEMSVVVAIIGVLYLTVIPMYGTTVQKAKEAALKENLHVMRKIIDQYFKDHQAWPPDLNELVKSGYLRAVPIDPLTKKIETWVLIPSEPGLIDVFDLRSGAPGNGLDGTTYYSW